MEDRVSAALLDWYDRQARAFPWRSPPGTPAPEPYRIWLSEVMLQQTTTAHAAPYFDKFVCRWPTVEALASAPEEAVMAEWAGLGYYSRARNVIACARAVAERGGFPDSEEELRQLPGLGAYTAAAVAAIAFGRRAVVVDANVERVVARLFAIDEPLPGARKAIRAAAESITPAERPGDFAQAMMDLGATICTVRAPACAVCPLSAPCDARREGAPQRYPVKAPKAVRPQRRGNAYWLEHEGHVLLVRRPGKGMLGGMLGFPTGDWADQVEPGDGAPIAADWAEAGSVDHVFTHFALTLNLYCAGAAGREPDQLWWPVEKLGEAGLPTLFAKLAARGATWQRAA